jgi:hypothetical protein
VTAASSVEVKVHVNCGISDWHIQQLLICFTLKNSRMDKTADFYCFLYADMGIIFGVLFDFTVGANFLLVVSLYSGWQRGCDWWALL